MRRLLIATLLLVCLSGYAAEESSPELSFVPTGLEISDGASTPTPSLGALGGIAQSITEAGARVTLPDFNFVRGVDLKWENWFAPSSQSSDEW